MKRIITILLSFLFISFQSVKAEVGMGVTGAVHFFDASGTETTRTSNEKNSGSHSDQVAVPEVFVEAVFDNGGAIGLSYIPTRDVGSESRSDTNTGGDTGTYTAEAELDNVIQLYADIPTPMSVAGFEDKFLFYGFLPKREKELEKVLAKLSNLNYFQIFRTLNKQRVK